MKSVLEDLNTRDEVVKGIFAIMDYLLVIRDEFCWPIMGLWAVGVVTWVAGLSLPREGEWPMVLTDHFEQVRTLIG